MELNQKATQNVLIKKLGLQPHPEGGFYKETYRSQAEIPQHALDGYPGSRNCCTGIYFLLTAGNFSAFHKIRQDEMWHHYQGGAVEVHVIEPDGNYTLHKLGKDMGQDEAPQLVVPGGCWFASRVANGAEYALTGCTVAPGFDFEDFVLAKRENLINAFPGYENIITELTR